MMLSKFESGYPDDNDLSNGQLLHDVEEISKALLLDCKTHQNSLISASNLIPKSRKESHFSDLKLKSKPKSKPGFDDDDGWLGEVQKSSSIWGWKPFKALSHIRQRKFTCCFFCHVHCIENLASDFDDLSMTIYWKRKDRVLSTLPSRVSNGVVEFEKTLMSKCAVYCVKNGPGNFVKYEPKHFLLYASVANAGGLDIGKHWVDLTRLLPLTIEDLEEDKCLGKWSTSFKLAGKAKGATLHVSFAFLVTKDGLVNLGTNMKSPIVLNLDQNPTGRLSFVGEVGLGKGNASLRRVGSVPSVLTNASSISSQFSDVKHDWSKDVFDYSNSLNVLYGKLEEGNISSPAEFDKVLEHLKSLKLAHNAFSCSEKDSSRGEYDDAEFTVIEKQIELEEPQEEKIKLDVSAVESDVSVVEVIDVAEIFKGEGISSDEESKSDGKVEVSGGVANDTLIDKHSVSHTKESASIERESLGSHEASISESAELDLSHDDIYNETKVNDKGSKMVKSLSLDDIANSVADDFFNLLQGANTPSGLSSSGAIDSPRERLLREFEEDIRTSGNFFLGVDVQEDDFDDDYASPSVSSSDFDIEGIDLLPIIDTAGEKSGKPSSKSKMKAQLLESLETKSLMQRWGLNEEAFQSSSHYSTGGFGSPIFVPSEEPVGLPPLAEGFGSVLRLKDGGLLRSMNPLLFQNAKTCGSLVLQASKPVVLPVELGSDVVEILQCMASAGIKRLCKQVNQLMPLEELSGKIIQHLAWEALCKAEVLDRPTSSQHESNVKIESHDHGCCKSDSSATVNDTGDGYVPDIALLALENIEGLLIEGLKVHSSMSDHSASSCIKAKSASDTVNHDELLNSSISLDEYLRLDAGMSGDHAKSCYSDSRKKSEGEANVKDEPGKWSLLRDDLTVALMTQLRDPLRNYEPVGAPMIVLIQVKKVSDQKDDVKDGQNGFPRFTMNQVHVAGLNSDSGVPEMWSSRRQQQAGSRWLLASGLTRNRYSQFSKTRSITALSMRMLRNSWTRNVLWSISSSVHGIAGDPSEFSTQYPLIRNPDIIFA